MIEDANIIYLDNNATTQLDPLVLEEMTPFLSKYYGNPSSGYRFGTQVREAVNRARERLASLFRCRVEEIVFTSCGTESNNAALNSALEMDSARQHIVTSAVEHSAIRRHCEHLAKNGCEITFVSVDSEGSLDLDELERAIRPETAIVSVMWANNETGVVFPVEQIAEIARRKSVLFHTDAVQAIGKVGIDLSSSPINLLSLSAHKLYGPKGVGALYVNRRSPFRPSLIGGGQENGRRAGTENVASIVALGKAAECAALAMADEESRVCAMRDRFETTLLEKIFGTFVNGNRQRRLSNTSNMSFTGIDSGAALILLDQHGICCSAGSACRTGSLEASHVLRAMKLSDERARSNVRFSFGRFNTEADVDKALEIVPKVIAKLRAVSHAGRPGLEPALA